jgi:hypothetical protein
MHIENINLTSRDTMKKISIAILLLQVGFSLQASEEPYRISNYNTVAAIARQLEQSAPQTFRAEDTLGQMQRERGSLSPLQWLERCQAELGMKLSKTANYGAETEEYKEFADRVALLRNEIFELTKKPVNVACAMCRQEVIESEMTDGLCIECFTDVTEEPVSDFAELQQMDLAPDAFKDLVEPAAAVEKEKQVEKLLAEQDECEYGTTEYEKIVRELDKLLDVN